jgi:hypothetical protein
MAAFVTAIGVFNALAALIIFFAGDHWCRLQQPPAIAAELLGFLFHSNLPLFSQSRKRSAKEALSNA